eukprot:4681595-Lingulodinium_polyedra.AAC.1
MDVSEDPLAATIQQLPEFEVTESDATVIVYPIPEGVDLVKLHAIIGRFGELIDFDGGGDAGPSEQLIKGNWVLRAQFYRRESAQLCIDTLNGHILDTTIPTLVRCTFDDKDLRAGQSAPEPPS